MRITARILRVLTNGPYSYVIFKNGIAQKAVTNQTDILNAMNNVRTDVAGMLDGDEVKVLDWTVTTGAP